MTGGLTDPPKRKFTANYEGFIQGSTAGELRKALADLPDEAMVAFVDSYEEDSRTIGDTLPTITAGIGFKWPVSPKQV